MDETRNDYRVLVADDDPNVHHALHAYFRKEGYQMFSAYDGEQALQSIQQNRPNMLLLDIMMPKMDGLIVCREVRKFSNLPIIMLTAKSEEFDKLLGLELGADNYIVKPFSPREVVARIRAVLRRYNEPQPESDQIVRFPQLEVNLANYQVKACGQVIAFTPKEVEILHMLTSNAGQVFSREQILSSVWGYDFFGDTRTVDTHIKRIRQKLPQEGVPWSLKTVYGVGYKFEVEQQ